MRARDVMMSPVITVKPDSSVKEVAQIFVNRRISGVPVVDDKGNLVGIVTEGDLLRRSEAGTARKRSSWLLLFTGNETLAAEYVRAHSRKVADVMTRNVITATPDTPLPEIASLLEKNSIKRIPIMSNGQLEGLITRANLIQTVATARDNPEIPLSDVTIRNQLLSHLGAQPWAHTSLLNVTVNGAVVDLWGIANSDAERKAILVAAETASGVRAVNDHLIVRPLEGWT